MARLESFRRWLAFAGPGAMVAIGYVDPGNWATDLAGGSRYGYELISVVIGSSLVAMLLQTMSARLGIATNRDLAEASRERWPRAAWLLWIAAELAIVATDLAEVLGSALALELLFGVPLVVGVLLTGADVGILLALEKRGSKLLERVVVSLGFVVAAGFAYELLLARPDVGPLLRGLVPSTRVIRDRDMLYLAVGILGATVMPHNLYLHSSLVRAHAYARTEDGRREAARLAAQGTVASLGGAMLLNAALLVVAAAAFFRAGRRDVADISDAHQLLAPLLGGAAPFVFAIALLAAGQSATMTGTIAGQTVMSGFLRVRWQGWQRRVVTRACALVPALVTLAALGDRAAGRLLVASQVVLSIQLPFAVVPLVAFTSDARRMGALVNPPWVRCFGWAAVFAIVLANVVLAGALVRGS